MKLDLKNDCRAACYHTLITTAVSFLIFFHPIAVFAEQSTSTSDDASSLPDPKAGIEILAKGLTLELVAEHPELATPTGIDVGSDQSIWVVSNHTHFRPDGYTGPSKDEIIRFAADGTRSVFFSGTDNTMDLELGLSGDVYVAQRDKILRLSDNDQDLVCDQSEVIIQLETEADYPHNGLSGLTWSPEGNLVFSIGENFAKPWQLSGTDGVTLTGSGEGGIFTCHPDGTLLRRIAKGFWNPFGLCFRNGELFAAENDPGSRPPCRLLHVVEKGDYGYQRKYGNAANHPFVCWNGELRGTLPMLHALGEAPCGIVPFASGLAVTSWTEHRLDFYPLAKKGESFSTHRISLLRGGKNFRPTCLSRGKDDELYFTDWVKGSYEIHGAGRIWKLKYDPAQFTNPLHLPENPSEASDRPVPQDKLRLQRDIKDLLLEANQTKDAFRVHRIIRELAKRIHQAPESILMAISPLEKLESEDCANLATAWKMAIPKDTKMAKRFLNHPSHESQIVALRWIADEDMKVLESEVENFMKNSPMDFQTLTATLAAINTLSGDPTQLVNDQKLLLEQINDKTSTTTLRANLLRLLDPKTENFGPNFWRAILDEKESLLVKELVRAVATQSTPEANHFLRQIANNESLDIQTRADAIAGFKPESASDSTMLLNLAASDEKAIREGAIRSFRGTEIVKEIHQTLTKLKAIYPDSQPLIDAVIDPASTLKNRPAADDLQSWNRLLSSSPGPANVEEGRRIFTHSAVANCSKCHLHSGRGNHLGPDLSSLWRSANPERILTSILQPSLHIDPQYKARTLLLDDGTTFNGILLRDGGGGREVYRNLEGKEEIVKTDDIVERKESASSLMPEGLLDQLTNREIKDLMAFISWPSSIESAEGNLEESIKNGWDGSWWFDFPDGYGGWLKYSPSKPKSAELLWRVGSPRPVGIELLSPTKIKLIKRSKKGETTFIAERAGDRITIQELGDNAATARGEKCPPLPEPPDMSRVSFAEPIELFNGKNLDGWHLQPEGSKNGWQAIDGLLVNTTTKTDFSAYGEYGNLKTKKHFGDCQVHIEFKIEKDCNSGVFINGLYEAQVVDRDSRMQGINGPGAIFGRIAPSTNAGLEGGQWQTYDITLVDRHLTVRLNDELVIENQPVDGCTGGALSGNINAPGPLYLQGDHTSVSYRNIWIKPRLLHDN